MNLALLLKYQRRKRKKYVISALLSLLKEKRKSKTCTMYVTFTVRQTYSGPEFFLKSPCDAKETFEAKLVKSNVNQFHEYNF